MARLTAAGERPSLRPAPARLPSSSVVTKTFIASIRSRVFPLREPGDQTGESFAVCRMGAVPPFGSGADGPQPRDSPPARMKATGLSAGDVTGDRLVSGT